METRFNLNDGSPFYFSIPWTATEKELQLCEKLIELHISSIRDHHKQIGARHDWWVKWRVFAP